MKTRTTAKVEFDGDTVYFYPKGDNVPYNEVVAFVDSDGNLVICTGEDGIGIRLDAEDADRFIEFLQTVKKWNKERQST